MEELERRAGRDSSVSSRPPSSDSPYKKKPRDRSLRERGKRRPGRQPGEPGTTMMPRRMIPMSGWSSPGRCRGCGAALAGEPVLPERRHQVTDIVPPPPPKVTEYVAQAKACPCCGTVSRRRAAGACAGPGQLRPRGARAGREPGLRASRSPSRGRRAAGPAGRGGGLAGVDGRDPRQGRRADRGQRVRGPGAGPAGGRPRRCSRTRPRPAPQAGCGTCTWPAPPT